MIKMVNEFGATVELSIVCNTPLISVVGEYWKKGQNISNMGYDEYDTYIDDLKDSFNAEMERKIKAHKSPLTNEKLLYYMVTFIENHGFTFDFEL